MKKILQEIPDILFIETNLFQDDRGIFSKTYHQDIFFEMGIKTIFKEEYYSISKKNVIRGMHFQTPPHDQDKMVYCVKGKVLDVILDLRKESPTFGKHVVIELLAGAGDIFIPKGFAHGFVSLEDDTIMCYKVETVYNKESDAGILWNSFGYEWPVSEPVLSVRDQQFLPLNQFNTPF